ncbi:MAG TPA: BON domain-containing protein [Allocoleopsis sp.]
MKKLTPFLLSGFFLLGGVACSDVAKTSADAPNSTENVGKAPEADSNQTTQRDATQNVRDAQIKADERARQQRNEAGADDSKIADNDVESLVRNRLEQRLPSSQLAVDADEGIVTISGTVTSQTELDQISSIAKEVQGVKDVEVKAKVATVKPDNTQ